MAHDKTKHFIVCFIVAFVCGWTLGPSAGFALAMAIGIGKEIYDRSRGGIFDILDIRADALGAMTATILLFLTTP